MIVAYVKRYLYSNKLQLALITLAFVAGSFWSTNDLLRKNDQAAILAGAHDWARGERQEWSAYYQVDKTYVLYAYSAAVLKANRALGLDLDPVPLANRAVAAAFWLALVAFVYRHRHTLPPVALLAVLTAPAILFNTQYLNSSTLSSAFLLLCVAALPTPEAAHRRRSAALAGLCFFLAVGARADILLLLPLLLWLITPWTLMKSIGSLFSKPGNEGAPGFQRLEHGGENGSNDWKSWMRATATQWALVVAGVTALVLGRVFSDGAGVMIDPFFSLEMAAGYLVFGFGAAGLLYLLYAVVLVRHARRETDGWATVYGAAGVLAFLLPVLFFLPQLHAPRYFWRGCEAVLLVSVLAPPAYFAGRARRRWAPVIAVVALVPLFLGVRLPTPTQPQPVRSGATLFPSGDGHYPMGAYLAFLGRLQRGSATPIDHNQRVWNAVRAAELEVDRDGRFRVLATPMVGYFMLEASLRGVTADKRGYAELKGAPFYMDSRTLMRRDVKFSLAAKEEILRGRTRKVSPEFDGICVLLIGRGDETWGEQTRLLNRLFAGNEYRVGSVDSPRPPNRTLFWFSPRHFSWATRDPETGWYYSDSRVQERGVREAWSALPKWMTIESFEAE